MVSQRNTLTAETPRGRRRDCGFTLVEMLVAVALLVLVAGAIFTLMGKAQKTYATQTTVLGGFQDARLALDQMVRDGDNAGFPPKNQYNTPPLGRNDLYTDSPFAWSAAAGYPNGPCVAGGAGSAPPLCGCAIGTNCAGAFDNVPGRWDVIFEGETNTQQGGGGTVAANGVQWIRYQLRADDTLYRAVVTKTPGGDPDALTQAALQPYITNVVNRDPAMIATLSADYPSMFPGGGPAPVFAYVCDEPSQGQPLRAGYCATAGIDNKVTDIRDVEIDLIVLAEQADAQTKKPVPVQLRGRAHRVDPNF